MAVDRIGKIHHGEFVVNGKRVGYATASGPRPYQEDELVVLPLPPAFFDGIFVGVFDGHGGGYAAQTAASQLRDYIVETEAFTTGNYLQALEEGF